MKLLYQTGRVHGSFFPAFKDVVYAAYTIFFDLII